MPLISNGLDLDVGRGGQITDLAGLRAQVDFGRVLRDRFDRPYVVCNVGEKTNERGERVPIKSGHYVSDLAARGHFHPAWLNVNANSYPKEAWIELDRVILEAARPRLRAWGDLDAAAPYGGFNGMGRSTLEYQAITDPGEAFVDMDALTEGTNDELLNHLRSLPLPITHSGFFLSKRQQEIAQSGGLRLDTTYAATAARRVAERVERMTIGLGGAFAYGAVTSGPTAHDTRTAQAAQDSTASQFLTTAMDSAVYGYLNFPHRLVKTDITAPTAAGWKPSTLVDEFNAALELLRGVFHYGPFVVYNSTDWDKYLDGDYYALATSGMAAPTQTLRNRLRQIDGVQDIRRLDFLTPTANRYVTNTNSYTLVFVQLPGNSRAVTGMGLTTTMWPSKGGLRTDWKIMTIMVPNLRSDAYADCEILVATTS